MSQFKIPSNEKQVIQSNNGDYGGNIWSSYNLDLESNQGTIKVAPRLDQILDGTYFDDGDIIQALQIHGGRYYVATSETVSSCSVVQDPTDSSNWSKNASLGLEDLGLETDMTSFSGLLLISLGTDIMSWDGSSKNDDWWTTIAGGSALTANKVHTMNVLRTGNDTLFITDGNLVRYYNGAAAGTIITLDTLLTANCLTPSLDRMWVGTYTEVENSAYVYEIRVGDDSALQSYEVDGRVVLAMFTYNNAPYVITEKGFIQVFNGAGFQTVAQFPWANESKVMEGCRPGVVQDSSTNRAIHPKGAMVSGKYVYIMVDAQDEFGDGGELLSKRASSGVWVLNLETNSLTHKYALNGADSEYGAHKISRSGPLLVTNTPQTRIMVGSSVDNIEGVWMESSSVNQGYFVTTRHEADTVTESFSGVCVKADTLAPDENIVIKYKDRTLPNFPIEVQDITWLSSNQFTTTSDISSVTPDENGVYNYEVEIISGWKSGHLCQIVNIEGVITKTVTVDTSIGILNETSDIYIESWKEVTEQMTEEDVNEWKHIGTSGETSTNIQYKVILSGNPTLREISSYGNAKHSK